ncbi:MAG: hypothetical protein SFZ24_09380 [Planctomycetota bacterium]|nr:hypothetical protein [Planctomycetota bacterium]
MSGRTAASVRLGKRLAAGVMGVLLGASGALAWDGHGHRMITAMALDGVALHPGMPGWLQEAGVRARCLYQSSEADRWRGQRTAQLVNENNPDHYLDIEDLEQFGLTLRTMPPLRSEYIKMMAVAKAEHPERFGSYKPALDPFRDKEFPGFVAHSIMEHYAKLQASFRTLRILEALEEAGRADQVEQARNNVVYHIGMLSHFVGDAAQPLHTTRHFNGWAEAAGTAGNPRGYTTSNRFHAYIDGGVIETHGLTYEALRPMATFERCVSTSDPWEDVLAHLERSFAHVEDLYRMELEGTLDAGPGRELIERRLLDGADMLHAMIVAAWLSSEPDGGEIRRFSGWTPRD